MRSKEASYAVTHPALISTIYATLMLSKTHVLLFSGALWMSGTARRSFNYACIFQCIFPVGMCNTFLHVLFLRESILVRKSGG